jgi:hypothetical protein
MNIKTASKNFVSKTKYNNISELDKVSTDFDLEEIQDETLEGKKFTVMVFKQGDKMYKMPDSVLKQLKKILEHKPDLKYFKVLRSGTTKTDTEYTVMNL